MLQLGQLFLKIVGNGSSVPKRERYTGIALLFPYCPGSCPQAHTHSLSQSSKVVTRQSLLIQLSFHGAFKLLYFLILSANLKCLQNRNFIEISSVKTFY